MKKLPLLTLIFASVFLAISFFVDEFIALNFHKLHVPALDNVFIWITNIGSIFVVLFILTSLFLYEEKKREWIPFLWVSFLSCAAIGYILKFIIARPRPYDVLSVMALVTESTFSFPSIHAMIAFTALPILDLEFKKLKWFWIIFAVLVGFSRLYIGVHYLSDILAGAILGYLIGLAFMKFELKKGFFKRWNRKN